MFERLKFWKSLKSGLQSRQVFVNEPLPPSQLEHGRPKQLYSTNKVTTSKYTLLTFIPKNLYEQFRRIANFFFLLLVVLQWFPQFFTINPVLAALPMFIITSITAIKDGFEDFKRHVTDRSVNNRKTQTLGNWKNVNYPDTKSSFFSKKSTEEKEKEKQPNDSKVDWKQTMFKDVRVGDFIKLCDDDFIPADILILSTSEPNSLCYVETKNLDGETNLKIRTSVPETDHITKPEDCTSIRFYVDSGPPTTNLFSYNATVVFPHGLSDRPRSRGGPEKIPVNLNSMLLRGCVLKNTEWVIGMVIFTGGDTKLSLNSGKTPSKRSRIEKMMNPQVLVNLFVLIFMCLWTAIGNKMWETNFADKDPPFLESDHGGSIKFDAFLTFWNALITFQNIVPISLYLSIEVVKSIQAFFIFIDKEMYYKETDTPCIPKNWNLSDDLGVNYDSDSNKSEKKPFVDETLFEDMKSTDQNRSNVIRDFFTLLAICHTVLVNTDPNGEQNYKAQSPDEAALVKAAKDVGYTFRSRELNNIVITTPEGTEVKYELLNILEFTSARKRMSIIVRAPDDRIILYCKGADNVIFERLKSNQDHRLNTTGEHLEEFAREGLRTLCTGYAVIDPVVYKKWNIDFHEASAAIMDRDKRMSDVANQIEKDLTLLGATAIEDRLQDGVPECIAKLKRAGIKIWVLTGDKMETAISIGFSTYLLTRDMNLIIIRGGAYGEPGSAYEQMQNARDKFFPNDLAILKSVQAPPISSVSNLPRTSTSHARELSFSALSILSNTSGTKINGHALIIDGVALKYALEEPWSHQLLLELASRCKGVICCRVSPLQKAKVVELVKNGKKVLTCAIGDGANDVSMIQAAHIGIGVAGEEGLQAVMASDYSIAQFRFLTRLLLVHGHYAYIRNSSMILNFFYKNMIGVGVLWWYQLFNGYTATIIFEYTYLLFWNLFFTCIAVLAIGIFDRDVPDKVAIEVPELYQMGIRREAYSMIKFFVFMIEGIYQSVVCFFVPYYAYEKGANKYGRQADYLELGTTMAVSCIVMANLFTGFNAQCWTVFHFIAVFGSASLIFIYISIYSLIPLSGIYGYNQAIYGTGVFWFCIILSTVLCLFPRYLWKFMQRNYRPTDIDIIQEICKKDPKFDFANDAMFKSNIKLSRTNTFDSRYSNNELIAPVLNTYGSNTPRQSLDVTTGQQLQVNEDDRPETPTSITYMKTGVTEPMRGYAFSQEEGTGRLMHPLRRSKTIPGPLSPKTKFKHESDTLRRRSLPNVETEKMRMVQFRESLGGTIAPSIVPSRKSSNQEIDPRLWRMSSFLLRKIWSIEKTGTFKNLKLEDDGLAPPSPEQLRIKVLFCGLNFADIFAIFGLYSATPKRKFIPGLEFSGVVESVGEGLNKQEWVGKRVYGATFFGGYATYLNLKYCYVRKTPDDWTDKQACAFPLGRFKPNQKVLVHSAAGGCGLFALSILNKKSAKVVGTVGNSSKLDFLNEKYGKNPNFTFISRIPVKGFESRAKGALAQIKSDDDKEVLFDVVLDSIMGDYFWPNYNLLGKEGMLVLYGSSSFTPTGNLHPIWNIFQLIKLGWKYLWRPKIDPMQLLGFNLIHLYEQQERLNQLFDQLQELQLEAPHVGHEFDFENLIEALTFMQLGKSVGKIILCVKHPEGPES
ncbi:6113_t:CDS:10 [Diversispora eburnea]|uniref:Phospholipid-transporting ATPase n=1 Tax=Diversispora eburnea TaxID=1213867 RepID=A0A9N9A8H0_9GLOM|nr:6113_t:CDS:10 [Diversispora eburnea]